MSQINSIEKWLNLSAIHEKEIYDLQGKVADLVRLQLETLEERNKAEAENERLVNLVAYLKGGKPLTKHEYDIRKGLRTK